MDELTRKQLELTTYANHIRGLHGKTQEATRLVIQKGKELGIEVLEVESDEQQSRWSLNLNSNDNTHQKTSFDSNYEVTVLDGDLRTDGIAKVPKK